MLALDHQIAQKIHACTTVAQTAQRLFTSRRSHPWPPIIVAYEGWDTIYAEAADGLNVIDNINDAIEWANNFIARATLDTPPGG